MPHSGSLSFRMLPGSSGSTSTEPCDVENLIIRPLLGRESAPLKPMNEKRRSDVKQTVANFCNSIIGGGIMSLPFHLISLGILTGLLYLIVIGIIVYASCSVIVREAEKSGELACSRVFKASLGPIMGQVMKFCIIFNNTGLLIIYLIIISDVLVGSEEIEGVFSQFVGSDINAHESFYESRWFVELVVCIFFILPLVFRKDLSSLAHTSALAILLATGFTFFSFILALYAIYAGKIADVTLLPKKTNSYVELFMNLTAVLSSMLPAYNVVPNIPALMGELRCYSNERMTKVASYSYILVGSLYITICLSVYIVFGSDTQPDILLNFSPNSLQKIIGGDFASVIGISVSLVYACKVLFIYPLITWSLRENIFEILFGSPWQCGWRFNAVTVCIVVFTYFCSIFLKTIDAVMSWIGIIACSGMMLLGPGMMLLKKDDRRAGDIFMGLLLIGFATFTFLSGILGFTAKLFH